MIDWRQVRDLKDEIGPADFDEVVRMFLDEVEEHLARLRAAPDYPDREAALHALKSSALTLGFADLAALCDAGERAAAAGRPVALAPILACYAASKAEFAGQAA